MTMKWFDGSVWIDLTTAKWFDGANWIDLTLAKWFDGANWIDIPLPGGGGGGLSATVSDSTVFGSELRVQPPVAPAVLTVGSDSPSTVTVSATGGTGPYTYAWIHVSGDSAVQVGAPTSGLTGFVGNIGKNQSKSAVKRCVVTDSLGATAIVDVSVTLTYTVES